MKIPAVERFKEKVANFDCKIKNLLFSVTKKRPKTKRWRAFRQICQLPLVSIAWSVANSLDKTTRPTDRNTIIERVQRIVLQPWCNRHNCAMQTKIITSPDVPTRRCCLMLKFAFAWKWHRILVMAYRILNPNTVYKVNFKELKSKLKMLPN